MQLQTRIVVLLSALLYCVWSSATLTRHWAGTPDRLLGFLLLAPALGCGLMVLGIAWEKSDIPALAQGFYFIGLGLLSWRALWMFFSWDGLQFFPAWLLAASTLLRPHPRWYPPS